MISYKCSFFVVVLTVFIGFFSSAHAAVVDKISVSGNKRMDSEIIISYLTIRPGNYFSKNDINESLKKLFATGFFDDVSIYQNAKVLVVEVSESPIISKVFFEGNKRLKDRRLASTIRTKPLGVYSESTVDSDVELILEMHRRVGRSNASVKSRIVNLENNRVNVIFEISEGNKTKIKKINFVGNEAFSDSRLRYVIRTRQTNFFSWLSNDDVYDPDKLRADEELLRQFYQNYGFADFEVVSAVANFNEKDNNYSIDITVDEGGKYKFGNIDIVSSVFQLDTQALQPLLKTRSGESYSHEKIQKSISIIASKIAEKGYVFSKIVPQSNRNFEKQTVAISYLVDQGPRVYIERIEIMGNTKTRDYVIRREFGISEGDPLNQNSIKLAERNLQALDIFQGVKISTRAGSSKDKVILVVNVAEKSTASIEFVASYDNTSGAMGEFSFSERNFLGRGQFFKIKAGIGKRVNNYNLSFTQPYFLGRKLSAGFQIAMDYTKPKDYGNYTTNTKEGTVFLGIPIYNNIAGKIFYTYKNSNIKIASDASNNVSEAIKASEGKSTKSLLGYSIVYNSVDDQRLPRSGNIFAFNQEYAGIGGNTKYLKTTASATSYTHLSENLDLVGMLRARAGHILTFSDSQKKHRVLDNFFQGGDTIRGFSDFGFGPRDSKTDSALGGRIYFNGTAELQFPMPFLPEALGLRGAFFADIGTLFSVDPVNAQLAGGGEQITDRSIRASLGLSIIWSSPFGPLRADFSRVLRKKPWDKTQTFRIGVTSSF